MEEQTAPKPEEIAEIVEAAETGGSEGFNWKKLLALSSWAGILSWAILLVYVINFGFAIYFDFQQLAGTTFSWMQALSLLPRIASLLLGLFYFVILQILAEGINVWLEADDKLSALVEN